MLWEYHFWMCDNRQTLAGIDQKFAELGGLGWELATTIETQPGHLTLPVSVRIFVFKRLKTGISSLSGSNKPAIEVEAV